MLVQIRRNAPPSVKATMIDTGSVCPRKKVAVVAAINSGAETQLSPFSPCWWKSSPAAPEANAIMLTLKSTRTAFSLLQHLEGQSVIVDTQAKKIVSFALTVITESIRN